MAGDVVVTCHNRRIVAAQRSRNGDDMFTLAAVNDRGCTLYWLMLSMSV